MAAPFTYYVYELVDGRDGAVFYVGKGRGKRIEAHEAQARKGEGSDKCDRIREIWAAGSKVIRQEIAYFADEQAAYDFEALRIAEYDSLTNVTRNDARRARTRPRELDPRYLKVVAWWLKTTKAGTIAPRFSDPDKPFAAALANVMVRRGREFLDLAIARSSRAEVARGLKAFGVAL